MAHAVRMIRTDSEGSHRVLARYGLILGAALAALMTTPAPSAAAEPPDAAESHGSAVTLTVGRGDTLIGLLVGAGVSRTQAVAALDALGAVYDPRTLKIGQTVMLDFAEEPGGKRFAGLRFQPDAGHAIGLRRGADGGFSARKDDKAVTRRLVSASVTIRNSLFEAGAEAGVPIPVLLAVIATYSHDVDFQRDFQSGDHFDVLYERFVTESGEVARDGAVLHARLVLSGRELPIYRFEGRDGRPDYFNRQGESVRKALLKTPVDGARVTSRFGARNHPILGYTRMHRGVDFGAPTGTPVYASGNGVVEEAGRRNGFGNYVRIRHNTEIETAYGHLSRFAKGLRRGGRVEQGEVIAYVGATGMATGPHLHYEVLHHGDQVNPLSLDLPVGRKLDGRELEAFQAIAADADRTFREGLSAPAIADAKPADRCGATSGQC